MFSEEKDLRNTILELNEALDDAEKNEDWGMCGVLDLEIEDLTKKLQLIARPHYYSQEKL